MDWRILIVLASLICTIHGAANIDSVPFTVTDACSTKYYPGVNKTITITAVLENNGDADLPAGDNFEASFWITVPATVTGIPNQSGTYVRLADSVWTLTSGSLGAALSSGSSMTVVGTTTVALPEEHCESFQQFCLVISLTSSAANAGVVTFQGDITVATTGGCYLFAGDEATCDADTNVGILDCDGPQEDGTDDSTEDGTHDPTENGTDGPTEDVTNDHETSGTNRVFSSLGAFLLCISLVARQFP